MRDIRGSVACSRVRCASVSIVFPCLVTVFAKLSVRDAHLHAVTGTVPPPLLALESAAGARGAGAALTLAASPGAKDELSALAAELSRLVQLGTDATANDAAEQRDALREISARVRRKPSLLASPVCIHLLMLRMFCLSRWRHCRGVHACSHPRLRGGSAACRPMAVPETQCKQPQGARCSSLAPGKS
jgi:hypothetical protein